MKLRWLPFCLLLGATALHAQQLPGYSAAASAAERALEADAISRPDTADARTHSRTLSREPHVAGTPAQARTRDYVISRMKSWGLDTQVRAYRVYLPFATKVGLWRVSPEPMELPLQEPPIPGDPATALPQYPTANGST
ncbi:MAG TPA: hypothetical protein VFI96_03565, partial [Longimicrobiaceae bacterium]|nr:hypothetical protein [Longimicrobiaceae bacterium]